MSTLEDIVPDLLDRSGSNTFLAIVEREINKMLRARKIPASVVVYFPKIYTLEDKSKIEISIGVDIKSKE